MGARIDQINIEEMGPLQKLRWELGTLNLVYGRNEQGKTFLVEFLIRSLFRQRTNWQLRSVEGRGKVIVSGLADEPVSFTPSNSRKVKKLEDYLAEAYPGLPPSIGRLLVVRGGEPSLVADHHSQTVNRDVLRELLSGRGVLDVIQGRIQKSVQKATVDNGFIQGSNVGKIKQRNSLLDDKKRLDDLFTQLGEVYSGGSRHSLQNELDRLSAEYQDLIHAKRHQAYLLGQRKNQLSELLSQWPEAELDQLQASWTAIQEKQKSITRLKKQLAELEQQGQHFPWLQEAAKYYEESESQVQTNPLFMILGVGALLVAIVFSIFQFASGTMFMIILALIFGWLYIRQVQQTATQAVVTAERQNIAEEFENRLGQKFTGLPLLRQEIENGKEAYYEAQARRKDLTQAEEESTELARQLADQLNRLSGEKVAPRAWGQTIPALVENQRKLREELNNVREELATLNVEPIHQEQQPASVLYDTNKMAEVNRQREAVVQQLQAEENDLNNLKQRICHETGDDISIDWETLIQNLQNKRKEVVTDYCQETAQLLAEIVVSEIVETARAEEDEKVKRALETMTLHKPIHFITNRYHGIRLNGETLMLSDDYGEFALNNLSTGTQEQILLSLRMNFTAKLLGQDSLFVILDDAFQHSDWQRREKLVKYLTEMAQLGWQVIYFTMDDHIRGLFEEQGDTLREEYRQFDLSLILRKHLNIHT